MSHFKFPATLTAAWHRRARLICTMLTKGEEYMDPGPPARILRGAQTGADAMGPCPAHREHGQTARHQRNGRMKIPRKSNTSEVFLERRRRCIIRKDKTRRRHIALVRRLD